ncbi:MAG: hypothetical protein HC772_10675 [Leptolyngbyaceae cyanobacterium CRU_2_3]|nr:hypothetical protein [Leptolyngbyaceae cyanobacterium CRU_2_3]
MEVRDLKGATLSLSTSAETGDLFRIYGYYKFTDEQVRKSTIEGELGKRGDRVIHDRDVPDWDLCVTGEEPIKPGCSGAPVLNCHNKVIGIITHDKSTDEKGRKGSAISIQALAYLLQEVDASDKELNGLKKNIIDQLESSPPRRVFNIEFDNRFKDCASVEKLTLHETAYQNWYCLQFDFKCGRQEVTVPPGCLLDQRREIPGGMLRFGLRRGVLKLKTSDGSSFEQYRSVCELERRNGGIGWYIPSEIEDASQQFSITDKGIDEPIWEFEPKSRGNVKLDYMTGKGEISLGMLYLPNTDILRDKQIAAELVKEWYVQIYLADYKLAEGRFSGESLTEETNGVDLEILLPDQPLTKNQKLAIFGEFYSICLDPRLQPYLSNVKSVDLNGEKIWTL